MISCNHDNNSNLGHLQNLNDCKSFCNKFHCYKCNSGFAFASHLTKHKCEVKTNYKNPKNIRVNSSISFSKLCQKIFPRLYFPLDVQTFAVVNFTKVAEQLFKMQLSIKTSDDTETCTLEKQFSSIALCAQFLHGFLGRECQNILKRRSTECMVFMAYLQVELNQCLAEQKTSQSTNVNSMRYANLLQIKKTFLTYLKKVQTYIVCRGVDCAYVDILMLEILKTMLLVDPASEKIQYNTRKGRISNLSTNPYSAGVYILPKCLRSLLYGKIWGARSLLKKIRVLYTFLWFHHA